MDTLNASKKSATEDLHRADIVAALHKKGWSLRKLSEQSGLAAGTLRAALERPYPKAERIIAAAIGIAPEVIWPARYAKRNFTPVLTLPASKTSQSSQSLQHVAA
ncbi:helix-turn-helix domain-containing protein [Undibacterium sp. SXout11W]|uniref:helix-turn-helix domain-containing protein n=1 Tax=Undibacterium sp. SXout11W TaxID=3413050 RepID=UPI003BF395AC